MRAAAVAGVSRGAVAAGLLFVAFAAASCVSSATRELEARVPGHDLTAAPITTRVGPLVGIAFTPDSKLLTVGRAFVERWDPAKLARGDDVAALETSVFVDEVVSGFSLSRDGTRMLVGRGDAAALVDLASGTTVASFTSPRRVPIVAVALSGDARTALVVDECSGLSSPDVSDSIFFWDVTTGHEQWPAQEGLFPRWDDARIGDVGCSPDGRWTWWWTAVNREGRWVHEVAFRNLERGTTRASPLPEGAKPHFSRDGKWLVTIDKSDEKVVLFESSSLERQHGSIDAAGERIVAIGTRLFVTDRDGHGRSLVVRRLPELDAIRRLEHAIPGTDYAVSPDDRWLAIFLAPSALVVVELVR